MAELCKKEKLGEGKGSPVPGMGSFRVVVPEKWEEPQVLKGTCPRSVWDPTEVLLMRLSHETVWLWLK